MHPLNQHLLHHVAGGTATAVSALTRAPVFIAGLPHALPKPTPPYSGAPIHGPTDRLSTAARAD